MAQKINDKKMLVIPTPLEMEELEDLLMKFGIMETDDKENAGVAEAA